VTVVAGSGPGFSADGGPAAAAQLASPQAVSVDRAGNVYIAEQEGHRVRRLDVAVDVVKVTLDPADLQVVAHIRFLDPSRRFENVDLTSVKLQVLDERQGGAGDPKAASIAPTVQPVGGGENLIAKFPRSAVQSLLAGRVRIEGRFAVPGAPVGRFFSGDVFVEQLARDASGGVSGTVPATLSLTLGTPASFGAFTPGVARDYFATTTANVISTAADATLSVADPDGSATGRLVNGAFALPQAVQARANDSAYAPVGGSSSPTPLLPYSNPVSNDNVTIGFKQSIAANDALRTGTYAKTLTFTLSTTNP
jgi:hypothetical protein